MSGGSETDGDRTPEASAVVTYEDVVTARERVAPVVERVVDRLA